MNGTHAAPGVDTAIARGVVMVTVFAAITGVARVAQDAAIAWRFGSAAHVDAYYFVVSMVNWPVGVALSVFTLLLVPVEAVQRRNGGDGAVRLFRRELFGFVLLAAAASLPLAWLALHWVAARGLAHEPAIAAMAMAGVPQIAAVVPLGIAGALLSAWLVAGRRHVLTLLEALPPLVIAMALLATPAPVLFWATTAGFAVQLVAMALVLRAERTLPAPAWTFHSHAWRGLATGALFLVAAQLISGLLPLVDALFAARLGEGTLATLNYANRLVLGLQGLAGLAMQRASLPVVAALVAASPGDARPAVARWALIMVGVALLLAGAVAALAGPIVAVLYEHGNFSGAHAAQVSSLLRWGVLQLPAYLIGIPLVTALASTGARAWLAIAAAGGFAVKIAASAVLVGPLGAAGLQLATALTYTTTAAIAGFALWGQLRPMRG